MNEFRFLVGMIVILELVLFACGFLNQADLKAKNPATTPESCSSSLNMSSRSIIL